MGTPKLNNIRYSIYNNPDEVLIDMMESYKNDMLHRYSIIPEDKNNIVEYMLSINSIKMHEASFYMTTICNCVKWVESEPVYKALW